MLHICVFINWILALESEFKKFQIRDFVLITDRFLSLTPSIPDTEVTGLLYNSALLKLANSRPKTKNSLTTSGGCARLLRSRITMQSEQRASRLINCPSLHNRESNAII